MDHRQVSKHKGIVSGYSTLFTYRSGRSEQAVIRRDIDLLMLPLCHFSLVLFVSGFHLDITAPT